MLKCLIDNTGKACQGQTQKSVNYGRKKFYRIDTRKVRGALHKLMSVQARSRLKKRFNKIFTIVNLSFYTRNFL